MSIYYTKRGLCTSNALACGYMDTYRCSIHGHNIGCTMSLEGVYHVKLYGDICFNVINGTRHVDASGHYWYWQTYDTLTEARKGYTLAKREVKRVSKLTVRFK